MNIAKAMKVKNRNVARIKKILGDVQKWNSVRVGEDVPVDVTSLWKDLKIEIDNLIEIKTKIAKATDPIRDKLIRLAELKSFISLISYLDTTSGKIYKRKSSTDEVPEYAAAISATELNGTIEALQKGIDSLQDDIDEFNAKTSL